VAARGGRGRGGAAALSAALTPEQIAAAFPGGIQQLAELLGMGRGGRGGRGFGRGGAQIVPAGDYMVSITVNGQTQHQVLHVERTATAPTSDNGGFGVSDDDHR
jgi:hypothetical protein